MKIIVFVLVFSPLTHGQFTLNEDWTVNQPWLVIDEVSGLHTISATHGVPANSMMKLSLWEGGCRTDEPPGTMIPDLPTFGIDMDPLVTVGPSGAKWTSYSTFRFNKNILNGEAKREVEFCAVFDNIYKVDGNEVYIVNFMELQIRMIIKFDGDFEVTNLQTQAKAIKTDGKDLEYTVTAQICNVPNTAPPMTINQGEVVAVCICTPDFPAAKITGVDRMQYEADGLIQLAVTDEVANHLTEIGVPYEANGESCIKVTTLPREAFYPTNSAYLTVKISGSAILDFTNRRQLSLRASNDRHLNGIAEEPFEVEFLLASVDGSGAENEWANVVVMPSIMAAAAAGLFL